MKKVVIAVFLLLVGVNTYPADDFQAKLSKIYFPGYANLQWSFSSESSYPDKSGMESVEPAELRELVLELRSKDKGDPAGLISRITKGAKVSDELLKSKGGLGGTAQAYEQCGRLFKKTLGEGSPASLWKSYLKFNFDYAGFKFMFSVTDYLSKLTNSNASKDEIIAAYTNAVQNYLSQLASDSNIEIARRIVKMDIKDLNGNGILGSLIVGKSFITAISNYVDAASKNSDVTFVDVLNNLNKNKQFIADLRAAASYLKKFEKQSSNLQVNQDLGIASLLMSDFHSARRYFYKAIEINPNDNVAVGNAVSVFALSGWSGFETNEQKASGRELAAILEKRLNGLEKKTEKDYLILAKLYYQTGEVGQAERVLNDGLSSFPGDNDLLFGRALVYAKVGALKKSREALSSVLKTGDLDPNLKKDAGALDHLLP